MRVPAEGSVDRWPRYRKDFREIADGIVTGVVHPAQLVLLFVRQFGLFAAQLSFGSGGRHAFAGAHADKVGLELGKGSENVEEHFAHGIGWIVDACTQSKFDAAHDQSVGDGAGRAKLSADRAPYGRFFG